MFKWVNSCLKDLKICLNEPDISVNDWKKIYFSDSQISVKPLYLCMYTSCIIINVIVLQISLEHLQICPNDLNIFPNQV